MTRKRRRIDDGSTDDKHSLFTEWSIARGIEINSVKPASLPGRGLGLVTTSRVEKDTEILIIPEKAMFKSSPSIIGKSLKAKTLLKSATHHAHMALSVMSAMTAPESEYLVWKNTWPTPDDFTSTLPLFWGIWADYLPESIQGPLKRQREEFDLDWEFVQEAMKIMKKEWSKREFEYYWAIVNSRSFHYDQKSGKLGAMVLCPFIDYLNHGPTGSGAEVGLVKGKGYVLKAERDYGMSLTFLLSSVFHTSYTVISRILFFFQDTQLLLFPCMPVPYQQIDTSSSRVCRNSLFPHRGEPSTHGDKSVDLQADLSPAKGEEVLISYGSHSNEKLLLHYGFLPAATPPSPDDSVMLDSVILPKFSSTTRDALKDAGYLGSYAFLPASQDICFRTQVAVRAALGADWNHYLAMGEDEGKDRDEDVRVWLRPVVKGYVESAREKVKDMDERLSEQDEEQIMTHLRLIRERWSQIEKALDGVF
jgi:hypothetical protein